MGIKTTAKYQNDHYGVFKLENKKFVFHTARKALTKRRSRSAARLAARGGNAGTSRDQHRASRGLLARSHRAELERIRPLQK